MGCSEQKNSPCETYAMGASRYMSQTMPSIIEPSKPVLHNVDKVKSSPFREHTYVFHISTVNEQIVEEVERDGWNESFTRV